MFPFIFQEQLRIGINSLSNIWWNLPMKYLILGISLLIFDYFSLLAHLLFIIHLLFILFISKCSVQISYFFMIQSCWVVYFQESIYSMLLNLLLYNCNNNVYVSLYGISCNVSTFISNCPFSLSLGKSSHRFVYFVYLFKKSSS